ncbi:hypothetical protein CQW23_12436 [Capsicum baccatum]|uniref:C2 domain-containing protein n=1 Tax=Capsicum baccatum TaxID=33114 RepID=A0A2G2WSI8_CAPBA|nr:hypothetical protein CQW23_12436 [Capsicum baccatum]
MMKKLVVEVRKLGVDFWVMKEKDVTGSLYPYVEASILEVNVKDKDVIKDDFVGRIMFNLNEIPKRVPPDRPLAPQWYRLEDRNNVATVSGADSLANIRSKVYLSPKLWYLRVNVIESQDLIPDEKRRFPEVYVKAILKNQALRTRVSTSKTINTMWNEDMMFVAAEPFEEPLIAPNTDEVLGRYAIPLQYIDRRLDHRPIDSRWYNLEKHIIVEREKKEINFVSRVHMSLYLEGENHVPDESTHYSSYLRPTTKQLWKYSIDVLELGVLNAQGLSPTKTKDRRVYHVLDESTHYSSDLRPTAK